MGTHVATALEHRMDKKLDQMEGRLIRAVEVGADAAVQRVVGTIWERATYDAAVLDGKLRSIERRLEEHTSNENIHLAPGAKQR